MRCSERGAPQGRVTTTTPRQIKKKKNPPTICSADISHTGQRARASAAHLLALAGFEVVLMSRRHVVPCAGTGVSRMTCVGCSRAVLLDCLLCACGPHLHAPPPPLPSAALMLVREELSVFQNYKKNTQTLNKNWEMTPK